MRARRSMTPFRSLASGGLLLLACRAGAENRPAAGEEAGPRGGGADRAPVEWSVVVGRTGQFLLEYENSQRLEFLDSRGRPLNPRPDNDLPARLQLVVNWEWTGKEKSVAVARVVVKEIREFQVPGWKAPAKIAAGLPCRIRLHRDRKQAVEVEWKRGVNEKLFRMTRSIEAVAAFDPLFREAMERLWRLFPTSRERVARAGESWEFHDAFALAAGPHRKLVAVTELEYVKDVDGIPGDRKRAGPSEGPCILVRGAVRQELQGASREIQKLPGLFPGKVLWYHDRRTGFPRLLEVEKIARIPVPDSKLPVVKTLTHTYRLRVSRPRE